MPIKRRTNEWKKRRKEFNEENKPVPAELNVEEMPFAQRFADHVIGCLA